MEVGQLIGSYQIQALIGEGGMGSVYLAEHIIIGRKAAIKVLKKEYAADSTLVTRFINEARATNAIGHPGIVEILDFGTLPGDIPFLVMEYLRGESLARRLTRMKRLPLPLALSIAGQTAAGLGAAHEKGIVHCDLKPDNLFLTPDPVMPLGERVKVLDFGIAKLRKELTASSSQTPSWALMGTPAYMSPEQCRGVRGQIDARTDIYALGVILYQMLCGRQPFIGEGFGETLMMHMSQEPLPPSVLDPAVPIQVERAILKALAKTREQRFASMDEFRVALGETITPRLPSAPADAAAIAAQEGPATVLIAGTPPGVMLTPPQRTNEPTTPGNRARRRVLWLLGAAAVAGPLAMVSFRQRGEAPTPPPKAASATIPAPVLPSAPAPPGQAAAPEKAAVSPPAAAPLVFPNHPDAGVATLPSPPRPARPQREVPRRRRKTPLKVEQW
jgi:serine/threonine-protein kinase